jgi:two-component system OmpR family sensor kinase
MLESLADDLRVVQPERPVSVRAAPITVEGDAGRIFQAISNLAVNARVHTPPDAAIELVLEDGTVGPSRAARVAVIDHGPGLTPEQTAKVFDRFYRVDVSRSRQQGGSGLGLAIAAAIVESHHGTIRCEPTAGGGATFVIMLPLTVPRPAANGDERVQTATPDEPTAPTPSPSADRSFS